MKHKLMPLFILLFTLALAGCSTPEVGPADPSQSAVSSAAEGEVSSQPETSPQPVDQPEAEICPSCGNLSFEIQSVVYASEEENVLQPCGHGGYTRYNDVTVDREGLCTGVCADCGYTQESQVEEHLVYCPYQDRYYPNWLLPSA